MRAIHIRMDFRVPNTCYTAVVHCTAERISILHSASRMNRLTAVSLLWHSVQTFTGRIVPWPGVSGDRPLDWELEPVAPFEFDEVVPAVSEEPPFD